MDLGKIDKALEKCYLELNVNATMAARISKIFFIYICFVTGFKFFTPQNYE